MNLTRSSTTLFVLGIVLMALHVVDDAFLQPQAGTSAGDHRVSGLIPLAVLGLAAWAYPRLRPGARAALALSLVLPAILSGAEAIYFSGKTGLSGDDYTGLLALGAAPKQIWEARGGHTDGIAKQPAEYERRVVDFLDGSLLGR